MAIKKQKKLSKTTPSSGGFTDIVVVLDRSGSMDSVKDDTIGGFNSFLESQKAAPGQAKISLYQFDDEYEEVYSGVMVEDAPELTKKTFVPRGMTALYDALGRTIKNSMIRFEKETPENVVFVIITDGGENASTEFSNESILKMIRERTKNDKWEFVFIGANQDSFAVGHNLGIAVSNTMNYASTGAGTREMFSKVSSSMSQYRNSVSSGTPIEVGNFFNEDNGNDPDVTDGGIKVE